MNELIPGNLYKVKTDSAFRDLVVKNNIVMFLKRELVTADNNIYCISSDCYELTFLFKNKTVCTIYSIENRGPTYRNYDEIKKDFVEL